MSSRRKSGRITNKTLGKFTNTEDNPINLDSAESSKKKVLKRKIKGMDCNLNVDFLVHVSKFLVMNLMTTKDLDEDMDAASGAKKKKIKIDSVELLEDIHSKQGNRAKTGKEKMYETETETEEDVVGKPKKKQRRLIHESNVSKKWMVLNTRSSPAQLYRCIKLLRENQRKSVKRMGFAKLLSFNLDGIPSRLAHFVVDRLKPKKMEIVCRGGTLKITPALIHKLWGIPIGRTQIESIVPLETYDTSVSEWRATFDGRLLATRTLVEKIESAEDEDNFEFRMNFIMLFMTVLVECHKNGRAREGILSSPFNGPLAILTLLYVEGFECKGISVDKTVEPIEFWNKNRLKIREEWEIKHGGLGRGGVNPNLWKNTEEGEQNVTDSTKVDIEGVKKMLVQWEEAKNNIEMHLGELVKTNHDSEDIQTVIACYESLLEKKPVWPQPTIQNDNVYETVDGVLNDLCVNLQDLGDETGEGEHLGDETVGDLCMGEKGETSNLSFKEAVVDLNINIPVQDFTEHLDLETGRKVVVQDPINEGDWFNGPNWSLGITQNDVQEIEKGIALEGPNWSLGVSHIGTTTCVAENVVEKEHLDVPGTSGDKKTEVGANKEKGRPEETLRVNLNSSVEAADAAPVNKKSEEIEKMDVNLNESVEDGGAPSEKSKESVTNLQDNTAPHDDQEMELDQSTIDLCISQLNENTDQAPLATSIVDKDKDMTVDAKWNEIIAKFEATKVKPIREKGIADVNKSPYLIRGVDASKEMSKDEESIINFIWCGGSTHKATDNLSEATDESKKKLKEAVTENNDERKVVYHSVNHLVLKRVHLFSLRPDNEVNNQIIDAWVEVLNFEEKYRSTGWVLNQEGISHQERLDKFSTNMDGLIKGDLKLSDLKLFDMVFFPVLEFNHYYLIVFELKNSAISVIDNFHESIPLVGLRDNTNYYLKDSPYKVKDVFVQYMKQIQHPKTDDIYATPVQKLHLPWATKTNAVDCAVFVMRHMERFMGCGNSSTVASRRMETNGKKKKSQLNLLRKRILLHLLRSEVNVLRDTILLDARKK
ncbi:hypothetical protein E3N88_43972 [Mikania micrantha]|uniref:Ubiquitin-like protease family profile domain-containing protein n=1 Tax=Mikania micrantha TaxID=192012 RepID=A0A5N6LDK4_9ASTR|nr:hypothetical protein E3N88_43972 [Mikania micrantha]